MKIATFIENFNKTKPENTKVNPNAIGNYIKKELEVKDYVSFVEKQSIAQIVLESCSYLRDGVVMVDSIQKYIIFTITVLSFYTNLEFDAESDLEDYDLLCSYVVGDGTLLDAVIKTFEKEYSRCNDILNMMTSDLLMENNIEKQIGKFLNNLSDRIGGLGDVLSNVMSLMPENLQQLDIDKLTNIISKIK